MSIKGLRVHIAGSAAAEIDAGLLASAHEFVSALARGLIDLGAGLVVGVGSEPVGRAGLPCTFDWTILDAIAATPDPGPQWTSGQAGRFWVVGSQHALTQIPDSRLALWDDCTSRSDIALDLSEPGWKMGGVIRAAQVLRGDVLVALGGGAGTEQLAHLYRDEGKPVIAIRCDLGAYSQDGSGGGSRLQGLALSDPDAFFELREGAVSGAARLAGLEVGQSTDPSLVAEAASSLLMDLKPPRAFYVRLLDHGSSDFHPVEAFFRRVVDPVVSSKGYTPHEVGRDRPLAAFLNVEIFEGLHRAALVVADLTGVRPNCTMELGYALARRRRVVISAIEGTQLPFDPDKLPTHFWSPDQIGNSAQDSYRAWVEQHIDMPPIVD